MTDLLPITEPVDVTFGLNVQAVCPVDTTRHDSYFCTIEYRAVTHTIETGSLETFVASFADKPILQENLAAAIGRSLDTAAADAIRGLKVSLFGEHGSVTTSATWKHKGTPYD